MRYDKGVHIVETMHRQRGRNVLSVATNILCDAGEGWSDNDNYHYPLVRVMLISTRDIFCETYPKYAEENDGLVVFLIKCAADVPMLVLVVPNLRCEWGGNGDRSHR